MFIMQSEEKSQNVKGQDEKQLKTELETSGEESIMTSKLKYQHRTLKYQWEKIYVGTYI